MDQQEQQQLPNPAAAAGPGIPVDLLANLNQLIRQAVRDHVPVAAEAGQRRVKLKTPIFKGTGDVEVFLGNFQGVADAEEWDEPTVLLKLKESLEGEAQVCGNRQTVDGVVEALRLHYGITPREAHVKLMRLQRKPGKGLAEFAAEVTRLTDIAYADTEEEARQRLAMDGFQLGLNNIALQGHLLAVRPVTLDEMIRAGNEFLRMTRSENSPKCNVVGSQANPEEPDRDTPEVAEAARQVSSDPATGGMKELWDVLKTLTQSVEQLASQRSRNRPAPDKSNRRDRGNKCYGCGEEGHIRRDCPTRPWPKAAGNGEGPRQ